ncbi:MAG: dethiobiotin synthase [Cyclobacteriaceae bacterium]
MTERIIVAGIGTDTGKTVASAILCEALKADYWKPVQAGDLSNSDSINVSRLIRNSESVIHPEAYKLETPMSPHAAAKIDGLEIDPEKLNPPHTDNHLIVELAGGLMVPLTSNYFNIDVVEAIGYNVVLVADYYLGSINHTLLSWELLESRHIPILGIIFNGEKNPSTFDVIMHRTKSRCLLQISKEEKIDAETVKKYAGRIQL